MSSASTKRLSKADRREQLLATALAIVRGEGTDALTLGHVAERAGVTKPIAYEHFKTRSGLLCALYQQLDDHHVVALREALRNAPRKLSGVARVISSAFMACASELGPEWHAISAAMRGDEEMEAFQQRQLDAYVEIYRQALAPYSKLPPAELRLRCVGIIAAGDAMARQITKERRGDAAATEALTALIYQWLRP